ncbi:YgdI/YgdR family lipoprotein [Castellaniella sp.]|uniref:YgdI/YgdR family lipoprotein n=1 Tax=Castellaniella sp. TaxID=1955812 RepID=UPI003C74600B
MSKQLSMILAMTAASLTLAACSTPTTVTTRDGQTTYTADKPDVDQDKDFITYEKDGHEVQVNKSDVKQIEEVD